MQLVRSLLFIGGSIFTLVLFSLVGLLIFPLPFNARYAFYRQWSRINLWWLALTCGLSYQVEGLENIPPTNAIVFSKHQSMWETLALQQIFPPQVWVVKRELLWVPFFGTCLAMLKPIAIKRGTGQRAVEQLKSQGLRRLKDGIWVVIFPEGTRTAPGSQGKYRVGGAVLAEYSGYPVIPVAHNAGEYWPRRVITKKQGTIKVVVGPLIHSQGKTAKQINQEAEAWIESTYKQISTLQAPAKNEADAV